jgi:hypothetical protein
VKGVDAALDASKLKMRGGEVGAGLIHGAKGRRERGDPMAWA